LANGPAHTTEASPSSTPRRSGLGARVATHLLWLVIAIAVPLVVLSTLAILRVHDSQRATQEAALLAEAGNIAQLVDREFDRIETGLQVLARTAPLSSGDSVAITAALRNGAAPLDGAQLALVEGSGRRIIASSLPRESAASLPFGDAVQEALARGRGVSDLLAQDGTPVIAVAMPVPPRAEEAPIEVLVAVLPRTRLDAILRTGLEAVHRSTASALVVDPAGRVVAQTGTGAVSPDDAAWLLRAAAQPDAERTEDQTLLAGPALDGERTVYAVARAAESQYGVVLGVADSVFQAPIRTDLSRTLLIGGLFVAAALLAAGLLAQRLVSALRAVGDAESGTSVRTGLREFDELSNRLAITAAERDRVQRSIAYQFGLLRTVTEHTAEAIFLNDAQGRVTYVNPGAEALCGWRQEELIGQVLHDVLQYRRADGSLYPAWQSPLRQVLHTGQPVIGQEDVLVRQDGVPIDVECSYAPVSVGGKVLGAVMTVRDLTARKRAEKALRENEARLRDLLLTLDLATIFVRTPDGRIVFWSHGCEALYGWTAAEAVGRQSHELLNTIFPEGLATVEAALARDGSWSGDLVHTCRDGRQITVSARKMVRRNGMGEPFVLMEAVTDVTALREAEDALLRLNGELEVRVSEEVQAREAAQLRAAHAERVQALGQLAGGIAHDFNNVLQAVAGGAALIQRRPADQASVRRLSHVIADAAARGAAITRRMLVFARCGELEAEAIAPAQVLEGLREICAYTLGASIRLDLDADPGLPPLLADKTQLETALVNLATNARDAMPDGGTLRLSARAAVVRPDRPHPAGLLPGAYVAIEVQDTGQGMDRTVLARVVEPFFTTKGVGKGTGLGLSMVKGFVEQSGGGLEIDSSIGSGTRVTLWLPQPESTQKREETMTAEETVSPGFGHGHAARVLLVDDDFLVRETLAAQLEDAGYAVTASECGEAALALLDGGTPADILVTDLSMPGMSGLALIEAVHARRPRLPAILLTGYSGDAAALALDGAVTGFYSLIRKPVPGAQLLGRVAAMLEAASAPAA